MASLGLVASLGSEETDPAEEALDEFLQLINANPVEKVELQLATQKSSTVTAPSIPIDESVVNYDYITISLYQLLFIGPQV